MHLICVCVWTPAEPEPLSAGWLAWAFSLPLAFFASFFKKFACLWRLPLAIISQSLSCELSSADAMLQCELVCDMRLGLRQTRPSLEGAATLPKGISELGSCRALTPTLWVAFRSEGNAEPDYAAGTTSTEMRCKAAMWSLEGGPRTAVRHGVTGPSVNRGETAGWTVPVVAALMASATRLTAIAVHRLARRRPFAMCEKEECTPAATPAIGYLRGPADTMR